MEWKSNLLFHLLNWSQATKPNLPYPIYQTNLRNQICYLGIHPIIPNWIDRTKFTEPKLQNWIYKIKSTKQSVLDVKNQIYQTKSIQSNLNKAFVGLGSWDNVQ